MDCINPVWIFLLLICLLDPSKCFSIRRRSLDAYRDQNPYDLTNALKVLDRERRRLDTNGYGEVEWDDGNNDIISSSPDLDSIDDYRRHFQTYPYLEDLTQQRFFVPDNTFRKYPTPEAVPTVTELEEIFSDTGKDQGDDDEAPLQDDIQDDEELSPSERLADEDISSKDVLKGLSKDQMKALLDEVDRMQKENTQQLSEVKPEQTSQAVPVSEEELQEVFESKADENDGDDDVTDDAEQILSVDQSADEETVPEGVDSDESSPLSNTDRYWLLKNYLYDGEPRRVVKRNNAGGRLRMPASAARLSEEVARLKNEVARLRLLHTVEDKENDILADALKGATMAQLQQRANGVYMAQEFRDIEDAIKMEELLQMLKTDEDEDDEAKELVDKMLIETSDEDDDGLVEKRTDDMDGEDMESVEDDGDSDLDNEMGIWYDSPVREDVSDGAYIQDNEDDTDDDNEEDESIEDIILHMTPEERRQLAIEVETALLKEETGICPAAERLGTKCKFADDLGLPLDGDARSLCNRHEICYKCGATLGMSKDQCDAGYRGDAHEICEDEQCQDDSETFLGLMTQVHRYVPFERTACRSLCLKGYIFGVD